MYCLYSLINLYPKANLNKNFFSNSRGKFINNFYTIFILINQLVSVTNKEFVYSQELEIMLESNLGSANLSGVIPIL
jgi:hypothetical protein